MKLKDNKILYLASYDGPGVEKKINGFCQAAENNGYEVVKIIRECQGLKQRKNLVCEILKFDGKYVVCRSFSSYNIFFLLIFLKARLQGKVLILDQASPLCTYIKELDFKDKPFTWKIIKKLLTYIGGPLSFALMNRVIQYAEESRYFKIFSNNKNIIVGNGIEINRMPLRSKKYPDPTECIKLVGVASTVNEWHGYDRIIRAMGFWKKNDKKPVIKFDVVGKIVNDDLPNLAKENGVEDDVSFLGFQSSDFFNGLYSIETLAVGSLGLYSNGLYSSSVLKIREYCLAGIPFIACGKDPDFTTDLPFRFVVSNDNKTDDIIKVFETFPAIRKTFTDEEIRNYAINHLSFDAKFKEIMSGL